MKFLRSFAVVAAFGVSALGFAPAHAVSLAAPAKIKIAESSAEPVQYRRGWRGNRGWRGHGYNRRGRGWGPGAIAGGIIAGALIASAIREARASPDDIERCADEYRSFDPRTGTYTGYDGNTYVCPYLD